MRFEMLDLIKNYSIAHIPNLASHTSHLKFHEAFKFL